MSTGLLESEKSVLGQFEASGCYFKSFEIRPKIRILADLAPKTLEKATQLHLSSAKKGTTLHFKRLKFFSSKNSAKIDEFCTLCEFLTPNAEKVRGTKLFVLASKW